MPEITSDVLIVGAGHAGVQLAVHLTKVDPDRTVTLLSDEAELPYERPPLTKRLLYIPDEEFAPVPLRSAEYWAKSNVTLHVNQNVVAIDPDQRYVLTRSGERHSYRQLVWAAGGQARLAGLPGEGLGGVHSVRDFAHVASLRAELATASTAVVIGGGYVGLEIAAGLRTRGIAVTVLEMGDRLLGRVTGPVLADFFAELHRDNGVDVRLGVCVTELAGEGGRVRGVVLRDGPEIPADVVVIGVGMTPSVGPLLDAGAKGDVGGIDVDEECRTTLAHVFAVGDCVRQVSRWSVTREALRIESVHNASQQAAVVARAILGEKTADQAPPRFWSTQFGHELKSVGLPAPDDGLVIRGDVSGGSFSLVHLHGDRLAAIETVNRPRDFARAQALIAAGWVVSDRQALSDAEVELPRP